MNKLNKIAVLLAGLVLSAAAAAQTVDNWKNSNAELSWKNGSSELCWRNTHWTPATAAADCDGSLALKPVAPRAAAGKIASVAAAAATPAAPAGALAKVSYTADALFDFDKSVLKADGKTKLNELVNKIKDINLEVIIAVGHTDSVGTDAYNQKLSLARSEAVKAYLLSKGVDKTRIYTEGKGKTKPVADNKTAEGRAKNRRVEIEVVGAKK